MRVRLLLLRTASKISNSCRSLSSQVDVFDRSLKRRQRESRFNLKERCDYDYLRQQSASGLVDRIEDISRSFPLALELGCDGGHVFDLINEKEGFDGVGGVGGIQTLIMCDNIPSSLQFCLDKSKGTAEKESRVTAHGLLVDEEFLPFRDNHFDIVLSNLSLHWVNDLPSSLLQIKNCLKPDGVLLGDFGSTS